MNRSVLPIRGLIYTTTNSLIHTKINHMANRISWKEPSIIKNHRRFEYNLQSFKSYWLVFDIGLFYHIHQIIQRLEISFNNYIKRNKKFLISGTYNGILMETMISTFPLNIFIALRQQTSK